MHCLIGCVFSYLQSTEWSHGIAKKREHRFYGQTIRRGVRYSFTFRHAFLSTSEVLPKTTYNAVSEAAMDK